MIKKEKTQNENEVVKEKCNKFWKGKRWNGEQKEHRKKKKNR